MTIFKYSLLVAVLFLVGNFIFPSLGQAARGTGDSENCTLICGSMIVICSDSDGSKCFSNEDAMLCVNKVKEIAKKCTCENNGSSQDVSCVTVTLDDYKCDDHKCDEI